MSSGRTKIICTIGPASSSLEMLLQLARAGMNVARLNFSHGSHEYHLETMENIRRARDELGKNIGMLQDLSGPKIRTGDLPEEGVQLDPGGVLRLVPGDEFTTDGDVPIIPITYSRILSDIPEGAKIMLDDGLLELRAERRTPDYLECSVVTPGLLLSHKGVNFPDCTLSGSAPTRKDLDDLAFGIEHGVDFVALSFVQTADDLTVLRREIERHGADVGIIAKLETGTALKNLDAIMELSDGVMVARGDLGIETELTMVPVYQKQITAEANRRGVFSIIATQMLDSMIRNPLPTRAEVTDVANAVQDGADAIMLSGETAVGKHPVGSVRIMRQVADHVEENIGITRGRSRDDRARSHMGGEEAVARSVCSSAESLQASLIVAHTLSGQTARLMSRSRPSTPIVALTPSERTLHRLSIAWGVESLLIPGHEEDLMEAICRGDRELLKAGLAQQGDMVIVSAGVPAGKSGGTNMMKIHRVGEAGT